MGVLVGSVGAGVEVDAGAGVCVDFGIAGSGVALGVGDACAACADSESVSKVMVTGRERPSVS